jgi:hypothetical protein
LGRPERTAESAELLIPPLSFLAFGFFGALATAGRSIIKGLGGWAADRGYFCKMGRRQSFNSGLISVISIPGMTMNLQLSISRGLSSSGNLAITRQYWQS